MAEASQPQHLPAQSRQTEQPGPPGASLPSNVAAPLLTSFATFLTLSIHSLLYHRQLYPARTFITARAYNLPVQQSRHAGVCRWINDAVSAVAQQLAKAGVERVVFVVHAPKGFEVLERWVFDVGLFPEWGEDVSGKDEVEREGEGEVNWTDVNEGLRGGLRRLAYAAEKMDKPPEGSTFTLAVELREEAPAPIAVRPQTLADKGSIKELTCHSILSIGSRRNPIRDQRRRRDLSNSHRRRAPCLYGQFKPGRYSLSVGWSSLSPSLR